MGELSFLTIIISLAVCTLLVYAVFQYMKVRLTILEQSHKEQALILQQFIEESSTDIHRLYQMNSSSSRNDNNGSGYHDSIILEYANDNANGSREYKEKPTAAYNGPHMIHLDTAIFQNNRQSNLIEISSNSEDTTDSDSESSSDDDDEASEVSEASEASEVVSEVVSDDDDDVGDDVGEVNPAVAEIIQEIVFGSVEPAPEIKLITVDLGANNESNTPAAKQSTSADDQPIDVLAMLYKKAQSVPDPTDEMDIVPTQSYSGSSATHPPITGMSVTELRYLLKEKHKQSPEKHAEIQKMKKAELIQALQTL